MFDMSRDTSLTMASDSPGPLQSYRRLNSRRAYRGHGSQSGPEHACDSAGQKGRIGSPYLDLQIKHPHSDPAPASRKLSALHV
jgi:hypothetical protein